MGSCSKVCCFLFLKIYSIPFFLRILPAPTRTLPLQNSSVQPPQQSINTTRQLPVLPNVNKSNPTQAYVGLQNEEEEEDDEEILNDQYTRTGELFYYQTSSSSSSSSSSNNSSTSENIEDQFQTDQQEDDDDDRTYSFEYDA